MAKAAPFNVVIEHPDQAVGDTIEILLREEHGVQGVRILGSAALDLSSVSADLVVKESDDQDYSIYFSSEDQDYSENVTSASAEGLRAAISRAALKKLYLPLEALSSRDDVEQLIIHRGSRPAVTLDPSEWITTNPLIANLCRQYPGYGNLIRFLCNERGLFLKAANYPAQRAYWNSTTNGGLPVYKKADPIHEGTFLLHDLFHFVPVDPLIGNGNLRDVHKAAYVAHRLLSESSTLVLADMISVDDAQLKEKGYDVERRKIYPVYESILENTQQMPDIDKLLAANAYFCFTGDTQGFSLMGASAETLKEYREKYEAVFIDDFMWNVSNYEFMLAERNSNPRIREYYQWLTDHTDILTLDKYSQFISGEGINIPRMLSVFRADFTTALNYREPLRGFERAQVGAIKYLAGQRIVFARFSDALPPGYIIEAFDERFDTVKQSSSFKGLEEALAEASSLVSDYIQELEKLGVILPHEARAYAYAAPLYPVKFVNYERGRPENRAKFQQMMSEFIHVNQTQLRRLLEAVSSN